MHFALFGDSHVRSFRHIAQQLDFDIHYFVSASAKSLIKSNSQTNTGFNIISILRNSDYKLVAFRFGQVDIEYIFPLKLLLNSTFDFLSYVDSIIHDYLAFVKKCMMLFPKTSFSVASIQPTCLADNSLKSTFHLLNSEKNFGIPSSVIDNFNFPSLSTRTWMLYQFNLSLKNSCASLNIPFADNFIDFVDKSNMIMDIRCISRPAFDNDAHLSLWDELPPKFSSDILTRLLKNIYLLYEPSRIYTKR